MKRLIVLFVLVGLCLGVARPEGLFSSAKVQAAPSEEPTYLWHAFFGSDQTDDFQGVVIDSSGASYLVGSANASWLGPNDTNPIHAYSGGQDIVVVKLDPEGQYLWHTFLGSDSSEYKDYGRNIAIDSAGSLYVVGYSEFNWNYGATAPLREHSLGVDANNVVVKLDGNGQYVWHTFMGYSQANGIITDAENNVYVTGYSNIPWEGPSGQAPVAPYNLSPDHGQEIFVFVLNSAGAYQWHTFHGADGMDVSDGVVLDADNNLYLAGFSRATWNGPVGQAPIHAFTPSSGSDSTFEIMVVSLTSAGAYRWHTFYGSAADDFGYSLTNDASGNVYVAGRSTASWNHGTTGPVYRYSSNCDITVVRLNSAGAYQRHAFFGSYSYDEAYYIDLDQEGNLTITGQSEGDWEYIGDSAPMFPHQGGMDIVALKLNTNLQYRWHAYFGTPDGDDYSYVASDGENNLYFAGYSPASWDGPVSGSPAPLYPHNGGTYDGVVIKLGYYDTTTTVTTVPSAPVVGQPVALIATVSSPSGTPTGSVNFYDNTTLLGTASLSNGTATLSNQVFTLGTHPITAEYEGDGFYLGSAGSINGGLVVGRASTTTTVVASPSSPTFEQPVSLTATVTSSSGTPAGNVTFFDGTTNLGTVALSGGTATLLNQTFTVGNHPIRAEYAGNTNFYPSSGSIANGLTVLRRPTSTTVTASPPSPVYGTPVSLTATVTATSGTPTGTVTFRDGTTQLGNPVNLTNGMAVLNNVNLVPGTHAITAVYSGDAVNETSTGTLSGGLVVSKRSTTTTVLAQPTSSTYGQTITFTATVSTTTGNPTGNVVFREGSTTLSTIALSNGHAVFTTQILTLGTHTITAEYSGDTYYSGSNGSASPITVSKAASTTTVAFSANPVKQGDPVTLQAAVSAGYGTPTGSVVFHVTDETTQETANYGPFNLVNGSASYTMSTSTITDYTVTADYAGDANYNASTGSAAKDLLVRLFLFLPTVIR